VKNVSGLKEELAKFRNHELTEQTLLVWIQMGLTAMMLGIALSGVIASVYDNPTFSVVVKASELFSQLLILIGTIAIFSALVQHRLKLNYLHKKYNYKAPFSLASTFATAIIILGICSFFANLLYIIFYVFS